MSQTLGVSRSGYYRWHGRGPSKREQQNNAFKARIRAIWRQSGETYGSPPVHAALLAEGETLSRPRVARLMKAMGIQSQIRPTWVTTTDSAHRLPVAPNILGRAFNPAGLARAWTSDITFLPSAAGWLYFTAVMDLADRQVIGWSLATRMHAEATTIPAFRQAATRRTPGKELIFHSDRGSQYAATNFTELLTDRDITQSMSRKGNCWDNAPAESFFKTLKAELPLDTSGCSYSQVRRAVFNYVEVRYNRRRLHSSLDYRTPAQTEQLLTQQSVAA